MFSQSSINYAISIFHTKLTNITKIKELLAYLLSKISLLTDLVELIDIKLLARILKVHQLQINSVIIQVFCFGFSLMLENK